MVQRPLTDRKKLSSLLATNQPFVIGRQPNFRWALFVGGNVTVHVLSPGESVWLCVQSGCFRRIKLNSRVPDDPAMRSGQMRENATFFLHGTRGSLHA